MVNVFLDVHAASNAPQSAAACHIASSHPHMKTFTQWHKFLHVLIRTRKMSYQVPYHKERIFARNSDQQPRLILNNKFFQQFSITGLQTVPSTNFAYGQIHHNLRINLGIHHEVHREF